MKGNEEMAMAKRTFNIENEDGTYLSFETMTDVLQFIRKDARDEYNIANSQMIVQFDNAGPYDYVVSVVSKLKAKLFDYEIAVSYEAV